MKFTTNIVCNNCLGSRLYEKLNIPFNNPFQWNIILPEDMKYLIEHWDEIDFLNFTTQKGTILMGDGKIYKHYYTRIDNKVNIWWVLHIEDETYTKPTKIVYSDIRFVNLHYCNMLDYINEKYVARVKRMLESNIRPTFVICECNEFVTENLEIQSQFPVLIFGEHHIKPQNNISVYYKTQKENNIETASKFVYLFSEPKYSVLTYHIGEYEKVHEIQYKDPDVEYILVTDNPSLTSNTWNVFYDENLIGKSTFDKCYEIRFHPFNYVHTDTCLRIDGSVEIKQSISNLLSYFSENKFDIGLMIHPYRNTLKDEYECWTKGRSYDLYQACKCMNFAKLIGCNVQDAEGLYQLNFEIFKKSNIINDLHLQTFFALKTLGTVDVIERLDQTIFSAILNQFYADKLKCMFVEQDAVQSDIFQWYKHNSDDKIIVSEKIRPIAFGKLIDNIVNVEDFITNQRRIDISKNNIIASKSAQDLSLAIFAFVKDENKYLKEWVEYHLNLGFDKIYINDNNDINGERIEDVLQEFIDKNQVLIINKRGQYRQKTSISDGLQDLCMNECYETYKHLHDWVAIIDVDEFITIDENKFHNIKEYLSDNRFNDVDLIKLKWKIFTDNNLTEYEDKPVRERFVESKYVKGYSEQFKSIIKTSLLDFFSGVHCTTSREHIACNSVGDIQSYNGPVLDVVNNNLTYEDAYISHYITKTISEYTSKFNKRYYYSFDENVNMRTKEFFLINKKTSEKERILNRDIAKYRELTKNAKTVNLKARIFILGYKQFDCPVHNKDLYSIVNLKAKRSIRNTTKHHYDVPIIYTDKGDSISDRNDIYDEWTGIYWLWKNYDFSNLDYVGLCQYRRYFEFLDEPAFDILKDYDLTTGGFVESQNNNTVNFRLYHNLDDLKALGRYITDPEDIRHTVSFLSSNVFYPSNILFMKKELFFEFCEFVFGYIFKYQEGEGLTTIEAIESRILQNPDAYPANGRTPEENVKYQRQLVAFLMERLTNIWITKYNETHNIMRVSCIETEHTGQGIFKYQPVENK